MNTPTLPQWARQAKRETISKLYSSHAAGVFDEELADEVAYSMLARAESIIKVTKFHSEGILDCPSCSHSVQCEGHKPWNILSCICGWSMTRGELHKTYKHKQLVGGAAMPIVEDAVKSFPAKGSYNDKMFWIDKIIHSFHGELDAEREETGLAYRPAARNFIEGSLMQVVELIYHLAYKNSFDFAKSRAEWMEKLKISYVPTHIKDKYFI
ncbi:MAG: hypothetical protein FWG34_13150 [Oscillospiraceae bacterium]|nr:hypothetical protein [Oscillospiraceae bacterium]